jgi:hypothetical protein
MRAPLAILIASCVASFAGEKAHFFDTWEPRPALRSFWKPVRESWWNPELGMGSPRLAKHCQDYATRHSPEAMIPEIFADLKADPTELNDIVYTYLLAQWPRKKVLHIVEPYRHSRDPLIKETAEEFHDDLLAWDTNET